MLLLLLLLTLLLHIPSAAPHGLMFRPNQRGCLAHGKFVPHGVSNDAPRDNYAHFPAGNKSPTPGAGLRSQRFAAGPRGWTPFTPLSPSFRWRAGVCGDQKGHAQHHLRGGQFYHNGLVVASYAQNGILELGATVVAHHNGFFELHVCNVKLCGGEISENCFRQGHCQQLQRAWDAHCESRRSPRCAPIDRNYPGRWYLPCSKVATSSYERFGPTVIKYRLPKHLACEHCVLQWYWATGNGCNAPGVIDFFDSDKAPFWGQCRGQGGAVGGVARGQQTCGGSKFAEEYLQCADIRIVKRGTTGTSSTSGSGSSSGSGSGSGSGSTSGSTSGGSNSVTMVPREVTHPPLQGVSGGDGRGTVDRIYLYADGRIIQALYNKNVVNVGAYSRIAILAHTSGHVTRVDFFIDDRRVWTDYHSPYFMFGNRGGVPRYWNAPIVNSWFKLTVSTPSDIDSLYVAFVK